METLPSQTPRGASRELSLAAIDMTPATADIVRRFVPPPRFASVSFDNYIPAPTQPSQAAAVARLTAFVHDIVAEAAPPKGLFRRKPPPQPGARGIYLDGGFGVGKTHLLAAAYFAAPAPKAYLSFAELSYTIISLGMQQSLATFAAYRLLCIDEFELDDVANTRLAATFLRTLLAGQTRVVTTSNTLPADLGQGRFNADDFGREIGQIAALFETVRIEGDDFRHRLQATAMAQVAMDSSALRAAYAACNPPPDGAKLYATFSGLLTHLARHHPVRYAALLAPLTDVFIEGLSPMDDQAVALRFVHFIDKLYDQEVRLAASLTAPTLTDLFLVEYRDKGYAKKYRRCLSRLHELLVSA